MITFELKNPQVVFIMQDGKEIGRIFSPSSSNNDIDNAIQVCCFSEAFDLWGCGIYQGFKDVQLLFDGKELGGVDNRLGMKECWKCFRKPCQCEDLPMLLTDTPFLVKREEDVKDRLKKVIKPCGNQT